MSTGPHIIIKDNTPCTRRLAVELAHLIGFGSVFMEFPLLAHSAADPQCLYIQLEERPGPWSADRQGNLVALGLGGPDDLLPLWLWCRDQLDSLTGTGPSGHREAAPPDFVSATDAPHPIEPADPRACKGLESLFDKDYILLDTDLDLLPDRVDATLCLTDALSLHQLEAVCNLAARLGMETTAVSFPITTLGQASGNRFVLDAGAPCGLRLEQAADGRIFRLCGDGPQLADFSRALCGQFPLQKPGTRWVDVLDDMAAALAMDNVDGQLAWLEAHREQIGPDTAAYCSPKIHELDASVREAFEPVTFHGYKDLKPVHKKTYDLPWEVDVCRDLLKQAVWPHVREGDRVRIQAVLSEDKAVRADLEAELRGELGRLGAQLDEVRVLCAYKQGFSWLEEAVMPRLLDAGADSLEIAFRPFLPPGVTEWRDEDGATPSYVNISTDDENRWYDLPIRYLQELYPIDDILAAGLGLDRDRIIFKPLTDAGDMTYTVRALRDGGEVYRDDYQVYYHERCYLDAFPGMGKVHPGTGHITAWINGETVLDQRVRTDTETVWDVYQQEILPWCRDFCDSKTGGKPTVADQPFFAQMRLDIDLSEPNERLACREDVISSLDALHEDIYFVGTDFFKVHGSTATGHMLDAPGLILPVIRKRPGKPALTFTLYDQHSRAPFLDFSPGRVAPDFNKKAVGLTIDALRWQAGGMVPVISVNGPAPALKAARAYAKLLAEGTLAIGQRLSGQGGLILKLADEELWVPVTAVPEPPKDLDIRDIDISEHALIGYERYMEIIAQLRRVPGIAVYPVAESYLGRDVYAIELLPSWPGYVSTVKRLTRNPSQIINARHHANEVSSTNAGLMLLRELLTNDAFKGLADTLSLVMVPMENTDGSAIHYELQKDNPWWKLHIARYNAIGKEFYYEHFDDDTIHTEAMGFTRLWRRWLPDVVVDNHGVPTHEWEQPFSGYTAPSFKGFWLPRSLLYGYFWTVREPEYASNLNIDKRIEAIVAHVLGRDREIDRWNRDWQNRFEKYAHAWLPRLFPADYYENMINYWIPFNYDGKHRYASVRYPWITSVVYTSEVADETAQGEYLHLCARAHMLHDIAIIQMLRDSHCVFREETRRGAEDAYASCIRLRPLIPRA